MALIKSEKISMIKAEGKIYQHRINFFSFQKMYFWNFEIVLLSELTFCCHRAEKITAYQNFENSGGLEHFRF